ncbi:hypothetical protein AN958_00039 [Leucoagaricus sp. SymC.cos]|nr:hypothetical protein AN958_00039 [Leucoagaricus sp. SymC.cos]
MTFESAVSYQIVTERMLGEGSKEPGVKGVGWRVDGDVALKDNRQSEARRLTPTMSSSNTFLCCLV